MAGLAGDVSYNATARRKAGCWCDSVGAVAVSRWEISLYSANTKGLVIQALCKLRSSLMVAGAGFVLCDLFERALKNTKRYNNIDPLAAKFRVFPAESDDW